MKKLKISVIAVIALILGIAGSAFTAQKAGSSDHRPPTSSWFRFMGNPASLTELQDYTKYDYVNGEPCTGEGIICAVLYSGTASSGNHPDAFSSSFKTRIANVYNGVNNDASVSEEDE